MMSQARVVAVEGMRSDQTWDIFWRQSPYRPGFGWWEDKDIGIFSQKFALIPEWIMLSFTEIWNTVGRTNVRGDIKLSFRYIKFEMTVTHTRF